MELLLDQGLPRTAVGELAKSGVSAVHVGDIGMSGAADLSILEYAAENGLSVVSLDADFHAILATTGARKPSVVRIRVEGLRGPELAALLLRVIQATNEELDRGAVVSVTESSLRVRSLPIGSKPR